MDKNTASNLQPEKSSAKLAVRIATKEEEVESAYRLRYRVFAQDLGAQLKSTESGLDKDQFDEFCDHAVVIDEDNGEVVGYSRLLRNESAAKSGGFYTETEFDLGTVIRPNQQYMEIGRTCVDSSYRSGAVLALLWAEFARYIANHDIDALIGCASIPLSDGGAKALAVIDYMRQNHFTPEDRRAMPKLPLPRLEVNLNGKSLVPPLLKAYLRIGAKVCGEAHLDRAFNVADVMMMAEREHLNQRYLKHFMKEGALG